MEEKISWVHELGSPAEPGLHDHRGIPITVKGDDVARAQAEMSKGLSDVIFNLVLQSKNGDKHYVLGSIA
jgi:hypothetical protein